ncbi:DUF2630 family protein [Arthrobacter sp. ISL-30]|uniref:DUF2630 family protein n=1 Tax=Arthrobacter sp. ISL-30 TaxID=2819109 RepID=UPI001BED1F31|nr:DUF2630 family protein [Arthrobacter sp. ISL-30]MBT2515422.1 DUF2630 family protein [Arthrobacter sp. ISL-30]
MDNQDILQRIQSLVDEEHQLRSESGEDQGDGTGTAGEERRSRLRQVEQDLDQCWDLLRQRRARQVAGEDPSEAEVRPVSEVEGYQQ